MLHSIFILSLILSSYVFLLFFSFHFFHQNLRSVLLRGSKSDRIETLAQSAEWSLFVYRDGLVFLRQSDVLYWGIEPLKGRGINYSYILPSRFNLHFKFLTFGHSGAQGLAPECPNVRNLKCRLDLRMTLNTIKCNYVCMTSLHFIKALSHQTFLEILPKVSTP